VIQDPEHQQRGNQRLRVVAAKPEQYRCIEYTYARRGVACEAKQSRGDEHGGERKYPDIQAGWN
jgi:hypothetical protein